MLCIKYIFFLMVTFFIFSTASSPTANRSESPWIYSGYSSDELSEYEYADPYEGEGPYSTTPPPPCDRPGHEVCLPPAWGERIPGPTVNCRCLLCHQEGCHHAVRCVQCLNAPGCCSCIWGYMRSRYNSGCPLCRHGDPIGEDPLAPNQKRQPPRRREELRLVRRGRGRRVMSGGMLCGIGRARGRGRPQQEDRQEEDVRGVNRARRGGVGRRGRGGRGRATTMEKEEPER